MVGFGHAGEDVEKIGDFGGEGGAGGEETEIGIKAGGARMVVARSEVKVGDEVAFFTANEK
jgi:hypothetical protein